MNLINSTTYNGKTYACSDIKGIYPLKEFGLDSKFYGGNAVGIAKTTEAGIFLVIDESTKPIDIIVDESKIKVKEPKTEEKVNKTEEKVNKAEEKEPKTEEKEPKTEEKEPKTEEKVNKAEEKVNKAVTKKK